MGKPEKFVLAAGLSIAAMLCPAGASATVTAPNVTVDEYGGTAACSLRDAIQTANANADFGGCAYSAGPDVIELESGATYVLSTAGDDATNVNGDLDILGTTFFETSGPAPATIDASFGDGPASVDRIFDIAPTGAAETVDIDNLILTGGFTGSDDAVLDNWGGAIRASAGSEELDITNSRITGNEGTERGGAIYAAGEELEITNSTIDDNRTTVTSAGNGNGGGIYIAAGDLTVTNSTIAGNQAANHGGGIYDEQLNTSVDLFSVTIAGNTADSDPGGPVAGDGGGLWSPIPPLVAPSGLPRARNTLIADNRDLSGGTAQDCVAPLVGTYVLVESGPACAIEHGVPGAPIVGQDPLLAPLAPNGPGTTPTMGLLFGSPALDAGSPADDGSCPDLDQRGVDRTGRCDIGAFEGAITGPPQVPGPIPVTPPPAKCKKKKKKGKKKAAFAKKKKKKCGKKKRKR